MPHQEKFRIPRPSSERLSTLGELVDEIEHLVHRKSAEVPQRLAELNAQLTSPVDVSEICSYYGACSRDEFLKSHLLPDPFQHQNLTDLELLWLIAEMQKHFVDDPALQQFYGTILDINTSSTLGTAVRSIDPDVASEEILAALKANKSNIIHL